MSYLTPDIVSLANSSREPSTDYGSESLQDGAFPQEEPHAVRRLPRPQIGKSPRDNITVSERR